MDDFSIGDFVQVIMADGKVFAGILQGWTSWPVAFVQINGCGFPFDDIVTMEHA